MLYKYFFALFLFTSTCLFSQPVLNWQKTIGGTNSDDIFSSYFTNDNGFIIGGTSQSDISGNKTETSRGGYDFWIVKLDSTGIIQWDRTFGGNREDNLVAVMQTDDLGYFVAGSSESDSTGDKTDSCHGSMDFWILKLNTQGNILWQKTIGGTAEDFLRSAAKTRDGGFIIGGSSNSNISGDKTENRMGDEDYWILKLDSMGNIEWQNTIGGNYSDYLTQVVELKNGGYAVAGTSTSLISGDKTEMMHQSPDYWILKLDSVGNIIWQHTIGGDQTDNAKSIFETSDNGFLIGGYSQSSISYEKSESNRGFTDYWVVRLDSSGSLLWDKTIGGSGFDNLFSVIEMDDGKLLLGGESESNISGDKVEDSKGYFDFWLVGLSASGNLEWQKTIGGNGDDELYDMIKCQNGNILLAGSSLSDISGDKTENSIGSSDYWIISSEILSGTVNFNKSNLIEVFPNPAQNILHVKNSSGIDLNYSIVDLSGKELLSDNLNYGSALIDIADLTNGIYLIKFTFSDMNYVTKLSVVK